MKTRPDVNKAISIKHPWAYLIAKGIKDVENRTWRTNYRGRVYIHASGSHSKRFNVNLTDEQMMDAFESIAKEAINGNFIFGAIIGHVDIVDCVINHDSIWAEKSNYVSKIFVDRKIHNPKEWITNNNKNIVHKKDVIYNWVLSNAVLYDEPILDVKGKLSFWDCSEYIAQIQPNKTSQTR